VLGVLAEQLLSIATAIVAAEEVAREIAERVRVGVSATQQKPRETRVVRLLDVEPGSVVSETGPGRLVELVALSGTGNYELTVIADGRVVVAGTFNEYKSISQYSDWIDAFEDNGVFILRVSDVSFSTSLAVYFRPIVSPAGGFKLREVLAKIEKY
jgi:hypothetical protein